MGLGGGGNILPKQRGEVTLVCVADPGANIVEGQRGSVSNCFARSIRHVITYWCGVARWRP